MGECGVPAGAKDWASDRRAFIALWALPGAAMLAALLLEPTLRAIVWAGMLVWMGVACLLNARRCGRIHCRATGPYLLVMAGLVVAYATGAAPLGPHGWSLLGGATLIGFVGLWWGSERLWGKFGRP
jgi:hypothetical protein